jgi:hypothetical protein
VKVNHFVEKRPAIVGCFDYLYVQELESDCDPTTVLLWGGRELSRQLTRRSYPSGISAVHGMSIPHVLTMRDGLKASG